MGLAARFLEEASFSTVVLTPTPEFNREVGIPRLAAVEYPYGRPVAAIGTLCAGYCLCIVILLNQLSGGSPGIRRDGRM